MASPVRKKRKLNENEDRISSLPNELIHHILSFLDTQLDVEMDYGSSCGLLYRS